MAKKKIGNRKKKKLKNRSKVKRAVLKRVRIRRRKSQRR